LTTLGDFFGAGAEEALPNWGGLCGEQHPAVTKAWVRCILAPAHEGDHAGYSSHYVPRGPGGRLMPKPLLIHWPRQEASA
jgi:hypothetical protein